MPRKSKKSQKEETPVTVEDVMTAENQSKLDRMKKLNDLQQTENISITRTEVVQDIAEMMAVCIQEAGKRHLGISPMEVHEAAMLLVLAIQTHALTVSGEVNTNKESSTNSTPNTTTTPTSVIKDKHNNMYV